MPVLSTDDNPTRPAAIPGGQALRSRAASHGAAPFPSLAGRDRTAPTRSPAGRSGEGGPRMHDNDHGGTLASPVSGREHRRGPDASRVGAIRHNLPHEASSSFAEAVVDVASDIR